MPIFKVEFSRTEDIHIEAENQCEALYAATRARYHGRTQDRGDLTFIKQVIDGGPDLIKADDV
jgi:hypothetical protein